MTTSHSKLAPVAAAVLLVSLLLWNRTERTTAGGVDAYMERSAERIDEIPWLIGRFYGEDMAIRELPGVIRLLSPNRILQRRYVDPQTGEAFSLLIVHCGRADDMYGHFPPNCYPNAGWVSEEPPSEVVVHAGEHKIPARRYRFRHDGDIVTERTDILAFFVVPTGNPRFGGDMALVERSLRSPATDKYGAAQVQILTPAGLSDEARREVWDSALDAIAPVLETIAEGA